MSLLRKIMKRAVKPSQFFFSTKAEAIIVAIGNLPLICDDHRQAILDAAPLKKKLLHVLRSLFQGANVRDLYFQQAVGVLDTCQYILATCSSNLDIWFFCFALDDILSRKMFEEGIQEFDDHSTVPWLYGEFSFVLLSHTLSDGRSLAQEKLSKEFGLEPINYHDNSLSTVTLSDIGNSDVESGNESNES